MKPAAIDPSAVLAARKAAGLTQDQAAALVGAAARTWQDWEHGRRNMPASKFTLFLLLSAAPAADRPITKE